MAKIAGVRDIQTDIPGRMCSFKVPKSNLDFKAELEQFAETNSHLAEYTIQ